MAVCCKANEALSSFYTQQQEQIYRKNRFTWAAVTPAAPNNALKLASLNAFVIISDLNWIKLEVSTSKHKFAHNIADPWLGNRR